MWGQAGRAYVYLCYGMHHLLNLVTGEEGEGAAVLIRACEPLAGHAEIVARRGLHGLAALKPNTLAGPGKVGQALGLDRSWNVHDLTQAGGLEVHTAAALNGSPESVQVLVGPRVGIGYASAEDQAAPYRLALGGSPWVSHRRTLREE